MEHKNIKIIIPILIIGIILAVGYYFIKNEVIAVDGQGSTRETYEETPGKLADGELDPSTYYYHTNTGEFEAIDHIVELPDVPLYKDFEIYCIQPGPAIKYEYEIGYKQALALDGKEESHWCVLSLRTC